MKVIFLDIDGVLNTEETYARIDEKIEIDEFRLEYLKEMIEETDAKIVLNSSWNYKLLKFNNRVLGRNHKGVELVNLFNKLGIEIYDFTEFQVFNSKTKYTKGEAINIWLTKHQVESFVIVDDESTSLTEFINDKLIKTSTTDNYEILKDMSQYTGLCDYHVDEAINILNNKTRIR